MSEQNCDTVVPVHDADAHRAELENLAFAETVVQFLRIVIAGDALQRRDHVAAVHDEVHAFEPFTQRSRQYACVPRHVRIGDHADR